MKKKLFIILSAIVLSLPINSIQAKEVETTEEVINENVETSEVETTEESTTSNNVVKYAKEFINTKETKNSCGEFCTAIFRDKIEWHLSIEEAKTFTYEQMITEGNVRGFFGRMCPNSNSSNPNDCTAAGPYPFEGKNMEIFDQINTGNTGVYEVFIGAVPGEMKNYFDPENPYIITGNTHGKMTVYVHQPVVIPERPVVETIDGVDHVVVDEGTEITDEFLTELFQITHNAGDSAILEIEHLIADSTLASSHDVSFKLVRTTETYGTQNLYKLTSVLEFRDIMPTITAKEYIEVNAGDSIEDYVNVFEVDAFDSPSEILNVTVDSSNVDLNTPGEYTVTFFAEDNEGNTTSTNAKIIVNEVISTYEITSVDAEIFESELNSANLIELFNVTLSGSGQATYDINDVVFTVEGNPVKDLKNGIYTVTITLNDLTTTSILVVKAEEVEPEIEPEVEPEIQPEIEAEIKPEVEAEIKPEVEVETEPTPKLTKTGITSYYSISLILLLILLTARKFANR